MNQDPQSRNRLLVGIFMLVAGGVWIALATGRHPVDRFHVFLGILFMVAGVVTLVRYVRGLSNT